MERSISVQLNGSMFFNIDCSLTILHRMTYALHHHRRASVIFLKVIFATGVLSIPTAMVSLGAVGGAFNVLGWGALK